MTRRREPEVAKRSDDGVCCRIGDIHVRLRSDLREALEDFARIYPPATPGVSGSSQVIEMEVRKGGRSRIGRRLFRVYADGEEIGGWRPANAVFPLIEWGINLRVIAAQTRYLQLHAASMVRQGQGFIFAGDSGCGKSTLAAILLAHGWQYLCDEFALVDVDTLLLHSFPKALCIKAGSYPVTRQLGLPLARRRDYIKALKGRVGYVNVRDLGADRIAAPAPPRFIVFPAYNAGTPPQLTPMCCAHAVMNLYRSCFNKWAIPDGALAALTKLVGETQCFRLSVGEPKETVRLLESLCTHSAVEPPSESIKSRRAHSTARRLVDPVNYLRTRRDMLRAGAKLAYVAPAVMTLTAQEAFAAGSNPSGICSTGVHTGGLCETDTDCCSGDCDFGVCK